MINNVSRSFRRLIVIELIFLFFILIYITNFKKLENAKLSLENSYNTCISSQSELEEQNLQLQKDNSNLQKDNSEKDLKIMDLESQLKKK